MRRLVSQARNRIDDLDLLVHFEIINTDEARRITIMMSIMINRMANAYNAKDVQSYVFNSNRTRKMIDLIGKAANHLSHSYVDEFVVASGIEHDSDEYKAMEEDYRQREAKSKEVMESTRKAACELTKKMSGRTGCKDCSMMLECTLPDADAYRVLHSS